MRPSAKSMRRAAVGAGLLMMAAALFTSDLPPSAAQSWGGPYRDFPPPPDTRHFPSQAFSFCTIEYDQYRGEPLGFGWSTDWPDSGYNFMLRLEELTTIEISRLENGEPHQVNLRLTDPSLFNYPYIFMSDVGTAQFSKEEGDSLRRYLLNGGFLHVDDFWGQMAWESWETQIGLILPPEDYPIEDIPLEHDLFHIVFDVREIPQVPSIQYWNSSRDGTTSERGLSTIEPHVRGIWDESGRLIVLMTHNTDIADGWEKEREDPIYFQEFSVKKSYPLGINIVVYAMTH